MQTFSFQENQFVLQGQQIYRKNEYSFDFLLDNDSMLKEHAGKMGTTSLSIGTLQIEIAIENKALLYVWGFHPYFNWQSKQIPEVETILGTVILTSDCELQQGVALSISDGQNWQTFHDASSEQIVITKSDEFLTGTNIRINNCCIVELREGSIFSIVLRVRSISRDIPLLTNGST